MDRNKSVDCSVLTTVVLQLTSSPSNAKIPLEGSEFTLKFFLAWLRANSAVTKVICTCPSSKFMTGFSCVEGGEESPIPFWTELETGREGSRVGGCGLATTTSLSSMTSIPLNNHFFNQAHSTSTERLTLGCAAQIHPRLRVSLFLHLSFLRPPVQGQQLSPSHQWISSPMDKRVRRKLETRWICLQQSSFFW